MFVHWLICSSPCGICAHCLLQFGTDLFYPYTSRIVKWHIVNHYYNDFSTVPSWCDQFSTKSSLKTPHMGCVFFVIQILTYFQLHSLQCYMQYYDMTVWIWAGNYISFTIAAGLIRLHMPGVKKSRCQEISCVTRASACHHTLNDNHWHHLFKIPAIIGVKSSIITFNLCLQILCIYVLLW